MRYRVHAAGVALAIASVLASGVFAAVQVEEKLLGPANEGGVYAVSKSGTRVAYIGAKGTKLVVSVDGVEGPVFDELYIPTGTPFYNPQQLTIWSAHTGGMLPGSVSPVIMTDDGTHYAYAGRQGNDYVVIHDGKEAGRGPRTALVLSYSALELSPGGNWVHWGEMQSDGGSHTWRLVMNGKPGPWSGHHNWKPVFSGDDSRYAYVGVDRADNQKMYMIVDGKDAGYVLRDPVFTADGKLLVGISDVVGKTGLMVNGKLVVPGAGVKGIVAAPTGGRYAAIVTTRIENSRGIDELVVDGKVVKGTASARSVVFSPDGKRYAAVCENTGARALFMVVDGKAGNEYQGVGANSIYWTADCSKILYTVVSSGRNFLVVDDKEMPIQSFVGGAPYPIKTPATGSRYAFGTRDGSNRNFTVVVDGEQVLPPNYSPVDGSLNFTADGKRFAYVIGPIGRQGYVGFVDNGEVHTDVVPQGFSQWGASGTGFLPYVFSPDGKHMAFYGTTTGTNAFGLYVNKSLVRASNSAVGFPTFTPDSRHFIWGSAELRQGSNPSRVMAVYVDDEEALVLPDSHFMRTGGCWEMGADGKLRVISVDGNDVKLFTLTTSDETNVEMMVAGAAEKREKAAAEAEATRIAAIAEAEAATKAAAEEAQRKREEAIAAAQKQREEALAARQKAYEEAVAAKKKAYEEAVAKRKKALEDAAAARKKP